MVSGSIPLRKLIRCIDMNDGGGNAPEEGISDQPEQGGRVLADGPSYTDILEPVIDSPYDMNACISLAF